jgi:hypothetical protein
MFALFGIPGFRRPSAGFPSGWLSETPEVARNIRNSNFTYPQVADWTDWISHLSRTFDYSRSSLVPLARLPASRKKMQLKETTTLERRTLSADRFGVHLGGYRNFYTGGGEARG